MQKLLIGAGVHLFAFWQGRVGARLSELHQNANK
jgi:hypothetical protein